MRSIALVLMLSGAPAAAWDAGVEQTFGSRSYRETYGYAAFGSTVTVRPAFSLSRSSAWRGTFSTYSLGVSRLTRRRSARLSLGFSPRNDGYSRAFAEAAGAWKPRPESGSLRQLRLGLSLRGTVHRDSFQFVETGRRGRSGDDDDNSGPGGGDDDEEEGGGGFREGFRLPRAEPVYIVQTDVSASVGADVRDVRLRLEGTKFFYDRDLAAVNARESLALDVAGVSPLLAGYPDAGVHASADWLGWRRVFPYVSYARTAFKLGGPASDSYGAGVGADWRAATFSLGYEAFKRRGSPRRDYVAFGISLAL